MSAATATFIVGQSKTFTITTTGYLGTLSQARTAGGLSFQCCQAAWAPSAAH